MPLLPRRSLTLYARHGLAIGAGVIVVTVACAIVNARITGNYWFFLPSIAVSRALVLGAEPLAESDV